MSSSRNALPNTRRFVPRVESLEDRTVPSGNVRVVLFGGTLYVTGDDAGNRIQITGDANGGATVRALDATTTINGGVSLSVAKVERDLYIRLFGGDDQLIVSGMRNRGTLDADTGDGNDVLGVSGAEHRAATILRTGSGDDLAILNGSVFRRYVFLDTGAGDDQVIASNVGVVAIGLLNPSGNDLFDNRNSTLVRPAMVGFTNGFRPVPTTPPTPTLSTTVTDPTRTSPIALAVNFDEDVTGFDASDLTATNGTVTGFTAIDARSFTVEVTPTNQGVVTITAAAGGATDAAGNASLVSNTITLTFDSLMPVVTTNGQTTIDTTPTLTGTVDDPTATVRVTVNNQTYTATVSGSVWSANVTDVIPDGTFVVSATATDPAGNVGTAAPVNLTVDTTGPVVSQFNLAAASDSGTAGDLRTDASSVNLTGTTEANATVRLFAVTVPGTPGTGTLLAETTSASNGAFTFAGVVLAVGPNSFAVRSLDAIGNLGATLAQTFTRNTPPTVTAAIVDQSAVAGGADLTFNLTNTFADAERIARLTTTFPTSQTGSIDVHLFATQAGATVTNFLSYNYDNSVFHRLAPNFVLQGGGFKFNDAGTITATAFPPIPASPPIANQPGVSNTRGTIAMAKMGGNPNSATNEFFFNLADNSTNLDAQNGGFTVFGQVMNGGQQVVNAIASLSTFDGAGIPGAPPFPIRSGADTTNFPANITANDVALVTTVRELAAVDRMIFTTSSTNPAVATATVAAGVLTIDPLTTGTTTITVRATDLDGSFVEIQFAVNVS